MIFKKKQKISKQLSDYLCAYTSIKDEKAVSELDFIKSKASIIRSVKYRYAPISNNSEKAMIELMRIAIKNSKKIGIKAIIASENLTELLKQK
jgi:hypothetical protein